MAETRMSMVEIIIFVFIAVILILVPIFLVSMNSGISANIEENAVRRASYEILENLLASNIAKDSGLLLARLDELDGTQAEPVTHCYAYRVTVTSSDRIGAKNSWSFGAVVYEEPAFTVELPVYIHSDKAHPANLMLDVYDTVKKRCGKL